MVKTGVAVLCVILALIAATAFYAFFNTATTVSKIENRTLDLPPEYSVASWLGHDFDTDFDAFVSDHVAFREELIQITFAMEKWVRRPSKIRFYDLR
ncbi:MAG: hypothetical protein ABIG45_01915 [Bacillota bacterium]